MQKLIASALKQERVAGIKKSCAWVWEGKWLMVNKKVVKVARLTAFLVDCSHTKYCKRQDRGPESLSCRALRRNWVLRTIYFYTVYFCYFLWKWIALMFKWRIYTLNKVSWYSRMSPIRTTQSTPRKRRYRYRGVPTRCSLLALHSTWWVIFMIFYRFVHL